jgi:hypothetical protein
MPVSNVPHSAKKMGSGIRNRPKCLVDWRKIAYFAVGLQSWPVKVGENDALIDDMRLGYSLKPRLRPSTYPTITNKAK